MESPLPGRVVSLHQNYPNPFNPATTIRFSLRATEEVTLAVYDVTGRLIRTIAERSFAAGEHEVTWRGRDERGGAAPSGVYFVRLNAGGAVESQKIVLNK